MTIKFSKKQFETMYPNDNVCLDYIYRKHYSEKHLCLKCQKISKFYRLKNKKCYSCQFCGHTISPMATTIFRGSSTPLTDWFYIIYLFSVAKNGISAKEIERQLGVTYKCAHRIGHKIRELMENDIKFLDGLVEIDETFIGGKEGNKHKDKRSKNPFEKKIIVIGAVERKGEVIARVIDNRDVNTIKDFVHKYIDISAKVYTDDFGGYNFLEECFLEHKTVNHSHKQYKDGEACTNVIEGFWSQLKRSLCGTYHTVSKKYLQKYVDEFCLRYNNRHSHLRLFNSLLSQI